MLSSNFARTLIGPSVLKGSCSQCMRYKLPVFSSQSPDFTVPRQHYADRKGKDENFIKTSSDKFKVFKDDDSMVILDIEEERALHEAEADSIDFTELDEFAGLNTSRGICGVFEVEDLVAVLEKDNALDIFVVAVPANIRYVDYIVIASGKSPKHLMAIAEFVLKLYKKKRSQTDTVPRIINKKPTDWIALDIGNIALHLLTAERRKDFDLETFWSVGEKFDKLLNEPEDSLVTLLNENSFSLEGLEPQTNEPEKLSKLL
ncbi:uncharacterized protein LOC126836650 [Adelges cooleyi]|uniref:uncharacterized protein LOC126836650 n=1 Tax=Adelges cooleyi TaxID=133065 RepID=UPI00217FD9C6|nr:uncharacterized protein LOC126836650 [Adelges cooleyi]